MSERTGVPDLTCRETIELLAEYLDAALDADRLARLERHLEACDECRAYLATYRAARALGAAAGRVEMPAEMRRRLRRFLVAELGGA